MNGEYPSKDDRERAVSGTEQGKISSGSVKTVVRLVGVESGKWQAEVRSQESWAALR